MTDTTTLIEHAPYVLMIAASLIIGFMPFLLIHIVQRAFPSCRSFLNKCSPSSPPPTSTISRPRSS